jgi:hypothetical protein
VSTRFSLMNRAYLLLVHRENVSVGGKLIQPKYHRVCMISHMRLHQAELSKG